jgi:hypothetical protein
MNKYKLFRFGHCYLNKDGDFVIGLVDGDKKRGYNFLGSHAKPSVFMTGFQLLSRVIPNDGNWQEVSIDMYKVIREFHTTGHVVKLSSKPGEPPLIFKKY